MSVQQIPEELIARIEASDAQASWLLRIEIRCAQAWAATYATGSGARILTSKAEGDNQHHPLDDERDWRRAWIQIRALRFGNTVRFDR